MLKPCNISEPLRSFLELPLGTQIARAEVTKHIHWYIRQHDLYDKQNRQFIVPNTRLGELLDVTDGEKLHMFSIPQKMNPHFIYTAAARSDGANSVAKNEPQLQHT